MNDHRHHHDAFAERPDHDPLEKAKREAPSFNRAWLKDGEKLTTLQRAGFTIFSLLWLAFGLYLARPAVILARNHDFMTVILVPVCLGFLTFGIPGLRNVLRFPKDPQSQ